MVFFVLEIYKVAVLQCYAQIQVVKYYIVMLDLRRLSNVRKKDWGGII